MSKLKKISIIITIIISMTGILIQGAQYYESKLHHPVNSSIQLRNNNKDSQNINIEVNGSNNKIAPMVKKQDIKNITNINTSSAINITEFKLKNMATCIVKQEKPVPVQFDWSYEGCTYNKDELTIKYSWNENDIMNSEYGPNNPLQVFPDSKVGVVTAYIYVKAPNETVATKSCVFFISDKTNNP